MHHNTTTESHQVYSENTSASAQPQEHNVSFICHGWLTTRGQKSGPESWKIKHTNKCCRHHYFSTVRKSKTRFSSNNPSKRSNHMWTKGLERKPLRFKILCVKMHRIVQTTQTKKRNSLEKQTHWEILSQMWPIRSNLNPYNLLLSLLTSSRSTNAPKGSLKSSFWKHTLPQKQRTLLRSTLTIKHPTKLTCDLALSS
jgi:hypothetical protein